MGERGGKEVQERKARMTTRGTGRRRSGRGEEEQGEEQMSVEEATAGEE